jgi:6-phosphogluconolactonase
MDPVVARTEVLANPPALAERVAEWINATAAAAGENFRVALSGGSTPKTLYGLLASDKFRNRFPWRRVDWFWGDERFVPYDHPESNYRMVREAMLLRAPVPTGNIHPIPTEGDPEEAARRYERTLKNVYGAPTLDPARPFFDITLVEIERKAK